MHAFRFGVMGGAVTSRQGWLDEVASAEEMGYSTVFVSDHFTDKLAPLPALVLAAEHSHMRVGTLVLANDFRHPAVLAKEAATVDLLTEGRLELGLGTGWDRGDYEGSGIQRDEPKVRVDRFEEAVFVLESLWSPEVTEFDGEYYSIHLDGRPQPHSGRPTLLIGGGGRRMLGIAGRHADIVGISAAAITDRSDLSEGIVAAGRLLDQKLEWIREGAEERFDDLELNILLFGVKVTPDRNRGAVELAESWGGTPEQILASPHFCVGTNEEIIADLIERRQRWNISYPVVPASGVAAMAEVVENLSGT